MRNRLTSNAFRDLKARMKTFERFLDARVLRSSNPKDLKITNIVSLN